MSAAKEGHGQDAPPRPIPMYMSRSAIATSLAGTVEGLTDGSVMLFICMVWSGVDTPIPAAAAIKRATLPEGSKGSKEWLHQSWINATTPQSDKQSSHC